MTDTKYAPEFDRRAHTQLERHLVVGANTYEISASGTGDETVRLHLTGWGPDGATVGEISGGISPRDLPEVAEALSSTLAGLVALRAKRAPRPAAATDDRPKRHPNQGTRWSAEDDERLLTRWGEGAGERSLMLEFGRSRGGIRARLESLGAIEPGTTILYRDRPVGGPRPASAKTPATGPDQAAQKPSGQEAVSTPRKSEQGTASTPGVMEQEAPITTGSSDPEPITSDDSDLPEAAAAVSDGRAERSATSRDSGASSASAQSAQDVAAGRPERRGPRLLGKPPAEWSEAAEWSEPDTSAGEWR
ncbi:hypothetical protein [Symbioplanes lichenis]|uniref:hypothetical protein n=1 Tax=Symbioplanes lichenis TaxID=1629072 RepID=UPI00273928A6|nr:hypothetical protein [Actinoplanes lichenis]